MPRDDVFLLDILESAIIACQHVQGKRWDDFDADILCQDPVVRRFEIIGQAVGRVSDETKKNTLNCSGKR